MTHLSKACLEGLGAAAQSLLGNSMEPCGMKETIWQKDSLLQWACAHSLLVFIIFFIFWDRVPGISSWSQPSYVAENDLELLILHLPLECWAYRCASLSWLMPDRQALYHFNYILSLFPNGIFFLGKIQINQTQPTFEPLGWLRAHSAPPKDHS